MLESLMIFELLILNFSYKMRWANNVKFKKCLRFVFCRSQHLKKFMKLWVWKELRDVMKHCGRGFDFGMLSFLRKQQQIRKFKPVN